MARRIIAIEELCEHNGVRSHSMCRCPDQNMSNGFGSYPHDCPFEQCPGGSRRVLDPGSLKAHVADALLFEGWTCDTHEPDPDCEECQVGYERLSQRIWDALAGGEQP